MLKVKAREVDKGVENSLFYQVKVKKNFDAPCGYFKSSGNEQVRHAMCLPVFTTRAHTD
jgi:hypothetical protein